MMIINFNEFILNEAVNFFEKGKFWTVNGKKVRAVGSIPQNPQVLKFQEVDEENKPVGSPFVAKKGDVRGYKPTENKPTEDKPEETTGEKEEVPVESGTEVNPQVQQRYKEIVQKWKEEQKRLGKNASPGEGTRKRLLKQAESEVNFDEVSDVDSDIKSLSKRPAYDAVDRLGNLIRAKKVKSPNNVLKYLDFIKGKIQTGNVSQISMN
jgi:hypothetical protein